MSAGVNQAGGDDGPLIDGRCMQPPEPLERTLAALDLLRPGQQLTLLVNCHPVPLFNILRTSGFVWQEAIGEDGAHAIRIRHA